MTAAETVDGWYVRFLAYQHGLGQHGREIVWRTWISPILGAKRWREVTARDVERLRDVLDAAITARAAGATKGRLLGRSALDVWHLLTGAVRAARRCKRRELRVLEGRPDPCADVEPPGDARSRRPRRKTFLYPTEFLALVSCRRVPREWRRLYAIAAMLYLRPGELMVLQRSDVDLRHALVHVTKAWDYRLLVPKMPKTFAGVRDVPIPRQLLALLRAMLRSRGDHLAPLMMSTHRVSLPAILRRHLLVAGVTRPALHTSSMVTIRANFRTLRDTGITWLAMRGVGLAQIMRRAGHEDPRTTSRYIKQAEDLSGKLGKPFPTLPRELLAGGRRSRK